MVRSEARSTEHRGKLSCEGQGQLSQDQQRVGPDDHSIVSMASEVTQFTDTDIDSSYSWTMDPDIALRSSVDPDDTIFPGCSTGHPSLYGLGCSMASRFQQGHRFQPRPQVSA